MEPVFLIGGDMMHVVLAREGAFKMENSYVWKPSSWYCPNCGTMTTAFRNSEGMMKVECSNKECNIVMVRTDKGRRHSVIDVYAAKLSEHCKKNT